MDLVSLCARRAAIIAALTGAFLIAVLSAGLGARGVLWGGRTFAAALRSGLALFGW